jgi:hypothetical protein
MDWSTMLILRPKFYDCSFFYSLTKWLKFFYCYLLNFNCPTTKCFFFGSRNWTFNHQMIRCFFFKLLLTNFRNFFGHLEEVKIQITKKNWLLKFCHFQSLEYFPFLVIVLVVIILFFSPLNTCSQQPYQGFDSS